MCVTVPFLFLTDSYKVSHFSQYPNANQMVAYGEFRAGYDRDESDTRIVFYGLSYIIENFIAKKWTKEDLERADCFFATHNSGFTQFPYPRDLFLKFIEENEGYFPVRIEALPEATVIYPHVPVYVIIADAPYARLVTYLETILTMVWYPSTVATLSRRVRTLIEASFERTVDAPQFGLLESRLHDFGFRGCTSVEQSIIGGSAHLLNFSGTDTMSAAYYVQFHLNNGNPVGTSIPATEHSVMTSFPTEREAILHMIDQFGSGVFACVMDSYDYAAALSKVLPTIAAAKVKKGGFMVLRPDSGDPVETVLMALKAADQIFGSDINSKGFKVLRGCGVIQGDGVQLQTVASMLRSCEENGFSTQNLAFGMGGYLLQRVHRDTMSFATKLSQITYENGVTRDIMKCPKTDRGKWSLPGATCVIRNHDGIPIVFPREKYPDNESNLLQVVYDHGPVITRPKSFDEYRRSVSEQWHRLPLTANVISAELELKMNNIARSNLESQI